MCEDQFPEATQFIIDAAKRLELELELLPFGDEDVVGLQIQHSREGVSRPSEGWP